MSANAEASERMRGTLAGLASYLTWGFVPLFWKQMGAVPAWELIGHRILSSLAVCLGLLTLVRGWGEFRAAFATRARIAANTLGAVLITTNWTIYVWAVNAGHVVECSLGYYLTPLVSVAIGRWFLKEKLRPVQWGAVGCAACGVLWLMLAQGSMPWIALGLALSWGFYGLCRKRSPLGAVTSLSVETAVLAPVAALWIGWLLADGSARIGAVDARVQVFVVLTGVVTALPLVSFAYAARRVRLATLGLMQFTAPTVQFLIGVFVYREPFNPVMLVAFVLIWTGVLIYVLEQVRMLRAPSAGA